MRFVTVIATTSFLAQGALSLKFNDFEIPETPAGLVLTDVREVENANGEKGVVSIYNDLDPDGSSRKSEVAGPLRLSKRCGSNKSECHQDKNGAWDKSCYDLIDFIPTLPYHDEAGVLTPRSVCHTSRDNAPFGAKNYQCCISWSKDTTARLDDLINAARNAMRDCVWYDIDNVKSWVSAKSLDVKLGKTCVTQCLSNRPDGCN